MPNKPTTHTGTVSNRYGERKVKLRETAHLWITEQGSKYSKRKNGLSTQIDIWNIERLDLSGIEKDQPHEQ